MAIQLELEPPSRPESKEKRAKSLSTIKEKIQDHNAKFLTITSRLGFLRKSAEQQISESSTTLSNRLNSVKDFFVGNKYLPHVAIVFLAVLVASSNTYDRVLAKSSADDLVYVDPSLQYSITQGIGSYTSLINQDETALQRSILASTSADGFMSNIGSVATEITAREEPLPDNTSATIDYVVRDGDTLTSIGWKFGVKLASIKYVNDIDNVNTIRPGAKLKVPPRGYEVPASLIAKKEKEKNARLAAAQRTTITRDSTKARGSAPSSVNYNAGTKVNGYPYGYCTYYVATRRQVPSSWGDAKQWLNSASRAGYQTGSEPAEGAIVVTSESWWGHVAFVESVNGDQFTIAEMNARGWGVVSRRTISANDHIVRGFIY